MGRRVFSAEFKREAVALVRERGVGIRQAAADLGRRAGPLGSRDQSRSEAGVPGTREDEGGRCRSCTSEAGAGEDSHGARHFKKGHRLLRQGTAMKFRFMAKHRDIWPVRAMCALLEVSASGFYEWLMRPESGRVRVERDLLTAIRTSFAESRNTYGSPRVWLDLHHWGYRCSVHRVARLMRLAGITGRSRPSRLPVDLGERPVSAIAPNLLDRQFSVEQPNRRWLADFTYVPTGEGWLFVAVVLDLCSRRVVGWAMRARMTAELVIDALLMAIWRRGQPRELLHHSDHVLRLEARFSWHTFPLTDGERLAA
jgi:hypothetical protein